MPGIGTCVDDLQLIDFVNERSNLFFIHFLNFRILQVAISSELLNIVQLLVEIVSSAVVEQLHRKVWPDGFVNRIFAVARERLPLLLLGGKLNNGLIDFFVAVD